MVIQDKKYVEIYLKPEYQGIGLGAKLFADAKNELNRRGYTGFVVWTLSDNDTARSFYRNAGGKAVARGSEHFDHKKLQKTAYAWGWNRNWQAFVPLVIDSS